MTLKPSVEPAIKASGQEQYASTLVSDYESSDLPSDPAADAVANSWLGQDADSVSSWDSSHDNILSTGLTLFDTLGANAFPGIGEAADVDDAVDAGTSLYRAVSSAEADEAVSTQAFRQGLNSMEGKWFATNAEDASQWGSEFYGDEPFSILQTSVPGSYADSLFSQPNLDNIGPAVYADDLDELNSVHSGISELEVP